MLAIPSVGQAVGMQVLKKIPLDGDGDVNVTSVLAVGDVNGDGQAEYALINGTEQAKVYDSGGSKLWEYRKPEHIANNELQPDRSTWGYHPWGGTLFDLNGDGKDELIHFTQKGANTTKPYLSIRNGATGALIREKELWTTPTTQWTSRRGLVSVLYRESGAPLIVVAIDDYPNPVYAYDAALKEVWKADTPNGGHYMWPFDGDANGRQETVFVGKFALNTANGALRYRVGGWPDNDHIDCMVMGDIDPDRAGMEGVAIGGSGTLYFDADDGKRIWHLPNSAFSDPQYLMMGEFDASRRGLEIVIKQRASEPERRIALVERNKNILINRPNTGYGAPVFNADLDGDRKTDELVTKTGEVLDASLRRTVSKDWYWNQQSLSGTEKSYHSFWQWNPQVRVADVAGDSREEMIVFGRHALVIGGARSGSGGSSLRDNENYVVRLAHEAFRNVPYFNFQKAHRGQCRRDRAQRHVGRLHHRHMRSLQKRRRRPAHGLRRRMEYALILERTPPHLTLQRRRLGHIRRRSHRLDPSAHARPHLFRRCCDLDLSTDQVFEIKLQPDQVQKREARAVIDLRQQVDVALRPGFAACDRAEQPQPPHAERAQLHLFRAQQRQHPFAFGETGAVDGRGIGGHGDRDCATEAPGASSCDVARRRTPRSARTRAGAANMTTRSAWS